MDMSSFICRRVADVPPSGIRKFFDIVQEMDDVISLSVGEPDFSTPWHIRESCIYSLEQGVTSYTSNQGTLELREALSEYTRADCGVDYNPIDEILVTTGVSEAIDLAIRAITNPGDEIIVAEPCYVSYAPTVAFAGGVPVSLETKRENDFRLTKEELEEKITPKTKAVIINYPNNPTGAVMGKQDMEYIAEVILKHNIILISDEVYDKLTYDGTHTCAASINGMKDNTILLNGFSKAYAMTGWRVGYAMGNRDIIDA
ncbi:MAG: aminotransferase class I/II-fold pyridoxal phosphate-dependent enzyme, partial [Methanosarcinales archaeon]|nr:aminotransferase class I/II-fold pyridoxal phosphate-dependent enzyme [Methanosarcinales archaeon]